MSTPAHLIHHTREEEAFYVLEGEIEKLLRVAPNYGIVMLPPEK